MFWAGALGSSLALWDTNKKKPCHVRREAHGQGHAHAAHAPAPGRPPPPAIPPT
jgi:hypothetical protein